jgi:hemoglobin
MGMNEQTELRELGDLEGPEEVSRLVRAFYARVYADELLAPIFVEVAGVKMEDHLPTMERFWTTVLFGHRLYFGNPMLVHRRLDAIQRLEPRHHERWVQLFESTVDQLFAGPTAERAKLLGSRINENIQLVLARQHQHDTDSTTWSPRGTYKELL